MSETESESRMLTLSEVSQRTGISMPTLQRYKKIYQSRIPAEGKGRKQRYPASALPVFEELKVENAGRRGRPRKNAAAPAAPARRGRKPAAAAPAPVKAAQPAQKVPGRRGRPPGSGKKAAAPAAPVVPVRRGRKPGRKPGRPSRSGSGLLTLGQVSAQTGISYPTLVRYVRIASDRLPSEGTGRSRRFYPAAVDVFRELRQESGRGGRKPSAAKTGKAGKAAKVAGRRGPGRPPGRPPAVAAPPSAEVDAAMAKRLKSIEKSQENLEKKFRGFAKSLQKLFK